MEYERIRYTVDGHIALVTLAAPDLQNRVDEMFHAEIIDAFDRIRADRSLRAMILANDGTVFSAGGDFDFMKRCHESLDFRLSMVDEGYRLIDSQLAIDIPIVVSMNGHAIGTGASIALCCDAVVAHRGCRIGDPHVVVGLVAGDGGCLVWPQAAGLLRAKRHLLTGEPIEAVEAHQCGLITDLVEEPADVLPKAVAIAERIAALPPLAVRLTKRSLNRGLRSLFERSCRVGVRP